MHPIIVGEVGMAPFNFARCGWAGQSVSSMARGRLQGGRTESEHGSTINRKRVVVHRLEAFVGRNRGHRLIYDKRTDEYRLVGR